MRHVPVMVEEVVQYLLHDHSRVVVDATVGLGGHTEALLKAAPGLRVIGVDRDVRALEAAALRLSPFADRVRLVRGRVGDLGAALPGEGLVDGILLDLGVSSPQIDDPARGFAFGTSGSLDMRMGAEGETAREMLRRMSEDEIAEMLRAYGEVTRAGRVARAIRVAAAADALQTTGHLRDAVHTALGRGVSPSELARVFQAVRIALNSELDDLRVFLDTVLGRLAPGGRLVVLAYHSLEDRMVKTFVRDESATCVCPPSVPMCVCGRTPRVRPLTRRALRPTQAEIAANPRARSARLRAVEKIATTGGARA